MSADPPAGTLDKYAASFQRRLPAADALPLAKIAARLRSRFGTVSAPHAGTDRIEAAIRQAARNAAHLRSGQRFLLAFALAQPVPALRGKCVLQHESVLDPLLRTWEQDGRNEALKLTHWKGLFHSYMQAPEGPSQGRLRRLLRSTFEPAIRARRHTPAWVDGFRRHEQLLGDHPCAPYLEELILGKSDALRDLRDSAGVSIPPTSWFWQQLKEKLIARIERMAKGAFLESVERFIAMNDLVEGATDDLLAALLDRYAASSDQGRHPKLMQFALDEWSSPQLDSNTKWNFCSKPARQMVCRWIAREDLEQFYRLCKGDNAVDEARLEFWLRFQKQMTYTQILLGSSMAASTEPGIRKFVKERSRQGRLGTLVGGAANNAMLMQIGKWVFVEFSQIGTACRCIRLADGELEPGQSSYALADLRGTGEQWVHMPSRGWQWKFLRGLADKSIVPDEGGSAAPLSPATVRRRTFQRSAAQRARHGGIPSVDKLRALGARVTDHRAKGGALWVFPGKSADNAIREELTAMGFHYSRSKGAWYHS